MIRKQIDICGDDGMKYKLEDLFDLQMGKTPARNNPEYWNSADNKWISIGDLSKCGKYITNTKEYLSDTAVEESGISLIPENTVVMSFKLSIGKTAITSEPMYSNEAIMSFRYKHVVPILPDYLYYMFSTKDWDEGTNKAVMGKTLNKATLAKVTIDVHSPTEQRKIVDTLDKVASVIDARRQQLSVLDDLIKARFVEMFGDCRINPKAWNTVELGEISDVGSSKRVFVEELRETGIPFYRGTEVGALAEGKAITPELFITREHYEELIEATGTPLVGDLLMPSICPDGRIWVVDTEEPFYFKDGRVLWVHSISKEFDPVFLLYTLKDRIMTDYSSIASGTTFAELKIFALKQCRVFAVPMDLQKQFVSFVKQIDKSKAVIQKSLDETQLLFDSLMQKYFG